MPVHCLHIFDRKGKTLFTKQYDKDFELTDEENRKLIFGMIFSLREVAANLSPDEGDADGGLHSVRTGASTLHNYETASGLRFAMYTDNTNLNQQTNQSIRDALAHVYNELWIECVTRSPLFDPSKPNVESTNFEQQVDSYLSSQAWFK
jgi:hypothetical protein